MLARADTMRGSVLLLPLLSRVSSTPYCTRPSYGEESVPLRPVGLFTQMGFKFKLYFQFSKDCSIFLLRILVQA
jgi:hypothetical protein